MKSRAAHLAAVSTVKISLDGRPLRLPAWNCATLPAIQAYLEGVALQKDRVLWSLEVDGVKYGLGQLTGSNAPATFREIEASTIDFAQLSKRLLKTGLTQVEKLRVSMQEAALLVLINDPSVCHGLWLKWQEQLREPLVGLRALQELKGDRCGKLFTGKPLSQHLEDLVCINYEVENLFRAEDTGVADLIGFSEIIEHTILPWLRGTADYFAAFGEINRRKTA